MGGKNDEKNVKKGAKSKKVHPLHLHKKTDN